MNDNVNVNVGFENKLNEPVDVFFSFKMGNFRHRPPAFEDSDGNPISEIRLDDGKKDFAIVNLPRNFVLEIEVKSIPKYKGVEAIKIIPGTGLGYAHHMELELKKRNNKTIYIFKVHYNFSGLEKQDKDPTVIHPDEG